MIAFRVDGAPVPKARPRLGRGGNVYTPRSTHNYEASVVQAFRDAYPAHTADVLAGCALSVFIEFVCAGKGPAHEIRGDVDNMTKAVLDALNRVAYPDDTQVVEVTALKRRARRRETPGAFVRIERLES